MNDMSPIGPISGFRQEAPSPRILAVDDDRVLLMMLAQKLQVQGYEVVTAKNGRMAWDILAQERDKIDVILLDRDMPKMSGLDVVARLRQDNTLKKIPVVMQTGADSPEQIQEGINAGVFYYLTKPLEDGLLYSVLSAALRESQQRKTLRKEMTKHRKSFGLVSKCECRFRTLDEAESLSVFLANLYADPERVLPGLAELLINSVEHGNLGITYDEKSVLIADGTWRQEIARREDLPEYRERYVDVAFAREQTCMRVVIQDQGAGFDWRSYMQIDPARAMDNHGRGIAQANMLSFDELEYNDTGTRVTATVSAEKELDW